MKDNPTVEEGIGKRAGNRREGKHGNKNERRSRLEVEYFFGSGTIPFLIGFLYYVNPNTAVFVLQSYGRT